MAVRQRSGSIHLWGQLPFIRARADKRPAAAFPEIRSEGSRLLDWWRLDALLSLFSPVLLLIVWEVLTRSGLLNWRFFPAPTAIAETFIALLRSGVLLQDIASTLGRVAVGFFMGAVPGLILGLVMGLSRPVRTVLNPIARSVYPIPKIAIFPLILLIFGLGELSKYVAISTGVVFFLLFNTMTGVMSIEDIHLDVAKNYGASRFDLYRTVALPGALPDILVGIQQGIVAALLIVVTTEFVGGTDGVGALIWVAWQKFEVEKMYSGLLVMSLLGFVLQQLLELVAARVIPWKPGLYGLESKFRETNQ